MNTRTIAILTCILCISMPALGQYPLADRVPAEALGYIGWAGRSLTFDGSMVGQLLNEPALASMLDALREVTVEKLGDTALHEQAIEHAWEIVLTAWQHPIAIAVMAPAEGGPPMPTPVMIIDLGEDRESFAAHLDGLLIAGEADVEEMPYGPLTCKMIHTGGPPVVFSYVENLLVVSIDPEPILQISQLAEAESLQLDPKFIASMETVGGEDVQVAFYVDFTAVRETINGFMPPPPEETEEEELVHPAPSVVFNSRDIHSFWRALGIDETTAIAAVTRIVDRQLYTKMRVLSPAPHRGYLMLFAGQPITDEDLSDVPADADFVAVVNISPTDVLAEVRRAIGELWPALGEEGTFEESFDEAMMEFQEEFGFSLEDDVLASLGDTWVLSSAASQGGFLTGTVLSVEVTDPDKIAEVIARITEIAGALPELDEAGQPQYRRGIMQIRTVQVGRTEIQYLAGELDGVPSPIAPAWAVREGRLYFALWPQVLSTIFERESFQPITADETFLAYRARVADQPTMLCYVNTPAIVRQVYWLVLIGGTMGTNLLSDQGVAAAPTWVPSLAAIEKYVSPEISVASADDEGITIENLASLPLLSDMPGTTGTVTAMALPALYRVKSRARTVASMANLKGIAMSCMMYEAENMAMPQDFAVLVEDGYVTVDMFRCPHNDSNPPELINGELVGESDYVYVSSPVGLNVMMPSRHIIAYERPGHYRGEGTVVAFADGHVQFLQMADFTRLLAETEAANVELANGE